MGPQDQAWRPPLCSRKSFSGGIVGLGLSIIEHSAGNCIIAYVNRVIFEHNPPRPTLGCVSGRSVGGLLPLSGVQTSTPSTTLQICVLAHKIFFAPFA